MSGALEPALGAAWLGSGRTRFLVWAPRARAVEVRLLEPRERVVPLETRPAGYHEATVEGVEPGALYSYRLDGGPDRPDPASRFQPRGVHGPSQVVDPSFPWGDSSWRGVALPDLVLYELHVGTFTPEGTFDAVIPHLPALRELGITAVELMPVAQFPGARNWGYDGVDLFAVQDSYGGPTGLRRLVDACHREGLALFLDVVYNHLGPEGNTLAEFGPYFTGVYSTPWGPALNFDGPGSDEVRRFFIENALLWSREFHADGLRLDALHAILDRSARPFLEELSEAARREEERSGRPFLLIAESNANDPRLVEPPELGGAGLDAVWTDDFHHALHVALTGERDGYYRDFTGLPDLARALREGFVYSGQPSPFRGRRHGRPAAHLPPRSFVVSAQNHDQVGNRRLGERLGALVDFEALKLAAGAVLLSPSVPLLFMGEEYGERAPFLYFTSHSDPALIEAVREGRKEEFASFGWKEPPPDPDAEETFLRSRLDRALARKAPHRELRLFHKELLRLRREHPALRPPSRRDLEAVALEGAETLLLVRRGGGREAAVILHFGPAAREAAIPLPRGGWRRLLDSSEERWGGAGPGAPATLLSGGEARLRLPPRACLLYERTPED